MAALRKVAGQPSGSSASPVGGEPEFEPLVAPSASRLQREATLRGGYPQVPDNCVVTGGTGFVGQRLVEMLVERGAKRVVSFDIVPKPADAWEHPAIEYVQGDLRDKAAVLDACKGADCVWHNGAAVGPYHPKKLYEEVNYEGTLNVIEACKKVGCKKIVMSSSPSTRFDGKDVDGLTEEQMPSIPQKRYLAEYARTKAMGEVALREACGPDIMGVAVAPHQVRRLPCARARTARRQCQPMPWAECADNLLAGAARGSFAVRAAHADARGAASAPTQVYGPRDNLFLPNLLEVAGTGKLRVFGNGQNRICFSHVDNYAHGLIIAERALYTGSKAIGKFYICTDGNTHPSPEG